MTALALKINNFLKRPLLLVYRNPESFHPWQGNGSCMVNAVFIYRDLIRPQERDRPLKVHQLFLCDVGSRMNDMNRDLQQIPHTMTGQ